MNFFLFFLLLFFIIYNINYIESISTRCNNKGYITNDGTCVCIGRYTGADCSQILCPSGKAWTGYSTDDDNIHDQLIECSNMGSCNRTSGICDCRDGFFGSACDKLSCPHNETHTCSNNGKCLSLEQASNQFDGWRLKRYNLNYDNIWDYNRIYGCVCDPGFTGYDCSLKECPFGNDPVTKSNRLKIELSCKASNGTFYIKSGNDITRPIPYNSGIGDLIDRLKDLNDIIEDSISIISISNNSLYICNDTYQVKTIISMGRISPLMSEGYSLSSSLHYKTGGIKQLIPFNLNNLNNINNLISPINLNKTNLILNSGSSILYFTTSYNLICPPCYGISCQGYIYFEYENDYSIKIPYNSTINKLKEKLNNINKLNKYKESSYDYINITISSTHNTICDYQTPLTIVNTTINLNSLFGPLNNLNIINGIKSKPFGITKLQPHNITFNLPYKSSYESKTCSGRGLCNNEWGICDCFFYEDINGNTLYNYDSSNGLNKKGKRLDCGWEKVITKSCPINDNNEICNNNGICDNSTYTCKCNHNYFGPDCSLLSCPLGETWFEEPITSTRAHRSIYKECSNMGLCDYTTGKCKCRDGFFGSSCQYLDCPKNNDNIRCSGHGQCLSLSQLSKITDINGDETSYTYGNNINNIDSTWDKDRIFGCHCDNKDIYQPYNGPNTIISGRTVSNPLLSGWKGYDCSKKTCPTGSLTKSNNNNLNEIQNIKCLLTSSSFQLTFRQQTTISILYNNTLDELKTKLEDLTTINNIDIIHTNSSINTVCNNQLKNNEGIRITFKTELGDLPLIKSSDINNIIINEIIKGTKLNKECSLFGLCNDETGLCECMDGYTSGDGNNNEGDRGDCGAIKEYS